MAIYFTINKSRNQTLTAIFDADGLERARKYKQGLIRDGAYSENQITISGTDPDGNLVSG